VADAAHELRSPLAALQLQLQLLRKATDSAERESAQARLAQGIERARRLVEQLLALARQEARPQMKMRRWLTCACWSSRPG
jgi:two-component system OmpR family sensor kinase